jgi:hypothetical protein
MEHKTIYAALAAAQMKMEGVKKDAKNDAFKRDGKALPYATLASVLEACLPALNESGIAVYQPTVDDEGGRYVETILAHVSGETLKCRVPLIVQKNDMQGYGSAVTYARRYGLMSMAGIAPEDDDGNAAAKAAPVTEDRHAKPKADPAKAIGEACAYLSGAADLPDLQARWQNLPTAVKADDRVKEAKDAAKASLQAAPPSIAQELQDSIPY